MIKLQYIFSLLLLLGTPVYPQYITINHLNDLAFGDVFMGYSAEVQQTDPNSEKFSISHEKRHNNILVQLTLPAALTSQGYSIPITFDYVHSAWSLNDLGSGRTNFDPYSQLTFNFLGNKQLIYIWLGGIINVPLNIAPGIYQGTIILTAEEF